MLPLLRCLALLLCLCRASPVLSSDAAADDERPYILATNPLPLGSDAPDPDVMRVETPEGPLYVLTHSVYVGDFPIYSSRDLVNWKFESWAFGGSDRKKESMPIGNFHYCNTWAPEIRPVNDGFLFSFTATRFSSPQNPCPDYREDSGVYQSWSESPFGPFASDRPGEEFEPLHAGAPADCPASVREHIPFSTDTVHPNCAPYRCNDTVRLDGNLFQDPLTGQAWFNYAWYSNAHPITPWDKEHLGEHVSIVRVNASNPQFLSCDVREERTKVWAASPHDQATIKQLSQYCPRCSEQLSFTTGRMNETMMRDGVVWGVVEGSMMFRRGEYIYILMSHSCFDSGFYSVMFTAAKTVEDLDISNRNPDSTRIVGRYLIPSRGQAFGHGTAVLGPDNETFYYIHHHLNHATCTNPHMWCERDIYLSPLEFEDRGDGRGDVWIKPHFAAETESVKVYIRRHEKPSPPATNAPIQTISLE